MTQETIAIEKLNAKVEALSKQLKENTVTYATIQNLKNTLEKFYEDKKVLDEKLNTLKLNLDIDRVNKQYEEIQEILSLFKSCNMEQRLKDIETDIAILKEGGNI